VRGNLSWNGCTWLRIFNISKNETPSKILFIEILSELINPFNDEVPSKSLNRLSWVYLVICEVLISNIYLTWLVYLEAIGNLPALKKESKVVSTVIRVMDFSYLASVISKVVVNDVRKIIVASVESEHFAVIVEELLFRGDSPATQ